MDGKHKFFKSKERAEAFAAEVNGELYQRGMRGFSLELEIVDDAEGYIDFDYVVVWYVKE